MQHEGVKSQTTTELKKAQAMLRSDRRWDAGLVYVGIVGGILSAGAAGFVAAIGGPAIDFFGGWRPFCGLVSAVGMIAAASNAVHKGRGYSERISRDEQASTALRALDISLPDLDPPVAREKLGQIIKENRGVLA